jgi:hypothetical protein
VEEGVLLWVQDNMLEQVDLAEELAGELMVDWVLKIKDLMAEMEILVQMELAVVEVLEPLDKIMLEELATKVEQVGQD